MTNKKLPAVKQAVVVYCPKTFLTGRSLEERPVHIVPNPAVVSAPASSLILLTVGRELGYSQDATIQYDTYAFPPDVLAKAAGLYRVRSAFVTPPTDV